MPNKATQNTEKQSVLIQSIKKLREEKELTTAVASCKTEVIVHSPFS